MSEAIFELVQRAKTIKFEQDALKEEYASLKEQIITKMKEMGVNEMRNNEHIVKFSSPKTFDVGMLKWKHEELAERFVKETTITKIVDEISKEDKDFIRMNYPEAWEDCEVELTERLTIK